MTNSNTNGHIDYFDTITLNEVATGIAGGTTSGPDGLTKTSTLEVFRHQGDSTRLKGLYGLKVMKGAASAEYLFLTDIPTRLAYYSQFTNETLTFGVWVYAEQANNVKAQINDSDGTTSSDYASITTLEWVEIARASGGSITSYTPRILFDGADNDVAYISRPMLKYGAGLDADGYVPPIDKWVILDDTTLDIADSATPLAADDKTLDLESLSAYRLPQWLKAIEVEIVTKNSAVADAAGVELGKDSGEQNLRCYPQVNNMSVAASGIIPCDSNGDIYQKITTAGNTLSATVFRVKAVKL